MDLVEVRIDLVDALLRPAGEERSRAFESLIARHQREALALAIGLLRDRGDAEEAVQEAVCRAWKALDSLREPARFKAWFAGILYRICRDVIRLKVRDRRAMSALPPRNDATADADSPALRAAMELPDEYRDPLVLFYVQELTILEIAETLGITESNAKVRLHRARRMLRERLGAPS
jgi:RNA polymerase sigma-70 factor (ECF subfamily)